jgi:hypothetical protein
MPRNKKKPNVEIVPESQATLVPKAPAAKLQDMLDRMVRDRVYEILAERGDSLMEPDFRPKEIAIEIQQHKTMFDLRKWTRYFEKWGCRGLCGRTEVSHHSNGYCGACHLLIYCRLRQIKREFEEANPDHQTERQINHLTLRVRDAQALLGDGEK